MPRAFSKFPRSFSICARALEKLIAALDNVLPLVHVFSVPYFLLSSDNFVPGGQVPHKQHKKSNTSAQTKYSFLSNEIKENYQFQLVLIQ